MDASFYKLTWHSLYTKGKSTIWAVELKACAKGWTTLEHSLWFPYMIKYSITELYFIVNNLGP